MFYVNSINNPLETEKHSERLAYDAKHGSQYMLKLYRIETPFTTIFIREAEALGG